MKTMPFGKHKGQHVSQVGIGYLLWLFENVPDLPDFVADEIVSRGLQLPESANERKRRERVNGKHVALKAFPDKRGEHYERLIVQFDQAGGDREACPFDSDDYEYTGPSIGWSGGVPHIVPSEFPREFQ